MGFYDQYANRERNKFGVRIKCRQAESIFELASNGLRKPCKVLEYGPGDGYIAHLSRNAGFKYLGLEGSDAVAEKLLKAGFNVVQCKLPSLSIKLENYDICFMLHLIEHLNSMSDAINLLEDTRQHLSESGRLVIACPDFVRWKQDFYDCDYTHNLPFTQRRMRQLLLDAGFRIVYETSYYGPIFGWAGLPVYLIVKLLYFRNIDRIVSRLLQNDIIYRGYLSFLPNLLFIAERNSN